MKITFATDATHKVHHKPLVQLLKSETLKTWTFAVVRKINNRTDDWRWSHIIMETWNFCWFLPAHYFFGVLVKEFHTWIKNDPSFINTSNWTLDELLILHALQFFETKTFSPLLSIIIFPKLKPPSCFFENSCCVPCLIFTIFPTVLLHCSF